MKSRIQFMAVFLCLFLALGASVSYAFETPLTSESDKKLLENMGRMFQPIATKLNCDEFAWANIAPHGGAATLEYIPKGTQVGSWTRMMTITVYGLPKDSAAVPQAMNNMMGAMLQNYKTNATVINSEFFRDDKGNPSMYVEYKIGEGVLTEHNAGVFTRLNERSSGFIQIMSRGKMLDSADGKTLKEALLKQH